MAGEGAPPIGTSPIGAGVPVSSAALPGVRSALGRVGALLAAPGQKPAKGRMSDSEIYRVVIGTAGHIDHGKSSVVRQLTGVDPDRLPEEKNRGLTIDLGFAPMKLTSGETVGIIDVPGHEKFIKNMVAGASGIDLVVLVVAADDSVMPQTREHLEIMSLLQVRRGIIVVNKIDLIEEEMLELVEEEVRESVAGTFLEDAPLFRVSAVAGTGIDEFRAALEEAIREVPPRDDGGVFRMPIQRVFSAKGHGTVVTGIPMAGGVSPGDQLEILPLGETGRVRGIQAYKVTVDRAHAGHSTAINLSDVDFHEVHRGMVAATPGYFRPATMIEARLRALPHLKQPILHQMSVRFHCGTAEVVGRVYLLDRKEVAPGEEAFAQFRLAEPVVVAPGDRYVVRLESPMITLGGGEVLDRSTWRLKMGKEHVIASLDRKEQALGSLPDFVASVIDEAPYSLVTVKELSKRAAMTEDDLRSITADLETQGSLVAARGGSWFSGAGLSRARDRVLAALEKSFRENPYRVSVPKLEIRDATRLDNDFFEALLVRLDADGDLESQRGGKLALPGREIALEGDDRRAYDLLREQFQSQLFSPPRLEELATAHSISQEILEKIAALLVDQGVWLRLTPEVLLEAEAIEAAVTKLKAHYEAEGAFGASVAKDLLGTSRKFAIPILEYLDAQKRTKRVGDAREVIG